MDRARSLLDQVLTLGGDQSFAYLATIECWAVVGELEEARAVLRRAETALPLLPDFYLEVGLLLLKRSSTIFGAAPFTQPAATPTSTPVSLLAEEVLDRAVASRPDDAHFRSGIAIELLQLRPDLALKYAESAASMSTREGHSLMVLGLAQAMNNRVRDAKETLRRAAAQARGEGDIKLALEIEDLRRRVGDPLLPLMLSMSSLFDDMDDDLFDL
jgi:tetratricopeptide (TPR) repeat protein